MTPMKPKISHSDLLRLIAYNPDTGVFTQRTNWWGRAPGSVIGSLNKNGYVYIGVLGRQYTCHTLAWFYVHGEWADGAIDHINRVKSDNRIANLRVTTYSVNSHNVSNNDKKPTLSGVRGVCMISPSNRKRSKKVWRAYIRAHGVDYDLGAFYTKDDAVSARKTAEVLLGVKPCEIAPSCVTL